MRSLWAAIPLLLVATLINGCGVFSDADEKRYGDTRQPDALERHYLALANELQSSKPCYLIHPESLIRSGFNAVGSQVALKRSRCFFVVARASGAPDLCEKVRSVSTIFLSGADMNTQLCRRVASVRGGYGYGLDVPRIVALAGYTEEEVDAYLVSEERFSSLDVARRYRQERSSTYWGEVRRHLLHSEAFFERIDRLPSFGTAQDAAEMGTLAWKPRPQRPWVPPEQRGRSAPAVRVPAQEAE